MLRGATGGLLGVGKLESNLLKNCLNNNNLKGNHIGKQEHLIGLLADDIIVDRIFSNLMSIPQAEKLEKNPNQIKFQSN